MMQEKHKLSSNNEIIISILVLLSIARTMVKELQRVMYIIFNKNCCCFFINSLIIGLKVMDSFWASTTIQSPYHSQLPMNGNESGKNDHK